MRRSEDPFAWIKASEEKRLSRYREPREVRNPELWVSSKYDFTNPDIWKEPVFEERYVRNGREYIPTVMGCRSALEKSWIIVKRYNESRERRNEDETVEDVMIRINRIQRNLGMEPYRFSELENIGYYDELDRDDARQNQGYDDTIVEEMDDEPIISSNEEAQARKEEIESEREAETRRNDDW